MENLINKTSSTNNNSSLSKSPSSSPTTSILSQHHQNNHHHHHNSSSPLSTKSIENDHLNSNLKIPSTTSSMSGGLTLSPHHGFSAAFHNYHHHHHHHHHHANNNISAAANKSPFLLPAQLYKSLFASAMLNNKPSSSSALSPLSVLKNDGGGNDCPDGSNDGGGVGVGDDMSKTHFPRNLLFSCSEVKSPLSDYDGSSGGGGGGGGGNSSDKDDQLDEVNILIYKFEI